MTQSRQIRRTKGLLPVSKLMSSCSHLLCMAHTENPCRGTRNKKEVIISPLLQGSDLQLDPFEVMG